jgi:peroxiredoxin
MLARMATLPMPAVGEPAPDFALATPDGAEITLGDYRGRRRVVLWFSKGLF